MRLVQQTNKKFLKFSFQPNINILKFLLKGILFIFISLFTFISFAQDLSNKSLLELDNTELLSLFNQVKLDSLKAEKVANTFLKRVKKERDTLQIAKGYDMLSRIFNSKKNIKYADSLITLTKQINNSKYPGLGYLLKAHEYNSNGDIKEATENYLLAYESSVKNNNISYQVFSLGRLIFFKSIWGDKKEALSLQKKRHVIITSDAYYKKIYGFSKDEKNSEKPIYASKDELTSIFNFSFCYLNLRKLDSAAFYAKEGLRKSNFYKGDDKEIVIDYFNEILIEINYYDKNYTESIRGAEHLLQKINYENNLETLQNLYFFKGNSLLKLNNYKEGISYLIKSDSVFESENLQIKQPYQRELFEILLKHYKLENNPKKQIKYLNKLILADSIIIKNYQYFEPSLIKNFETPKLIDEKERLIASLTNKNETKSATLWWTFGALFISLFALGYFYRREQIYKKRFNALILENEHNTNNQSEKSKNSKLSKEIINSILDQLSTFENNEEYLSLDISIQSLAKSFDTNYKYLSKVINLYKEKRFSNYINDLRVEYAFNELKNDSKIRKYTIKAIAKECGFNSAESFAKAFYKKYGIYPSFYIKQLEKSNQLIT